VCVQLAPTTHTGTGLPGECNRTDQATHSAPSQMSLATGMIPPVSCNAVCSSSKKKLYCISIKFVSEHKVGVVHYML